MNEPTITINGRTCSPGEVTTIRAALTSLQFDLDKPNALGPDHHGRAMVENYLRCLTTIVCKLHEP